MPRKRIESKRKFRRDALSHPQGWLLFWLGWVFNEPGPAHKEDRQPFFRDIAEMKQYYFLNRERVLAEVGLESWAWHFFEPHDRSNCQFCKDHHIEDDISKYTQEK